MKSRKLTTYLLFGAVLVLWAVIIAKVISYRAPDIPQAQTQKKAASADRAEADRTLLLDYRDPFLEKSKPRPAERQYGSQAAVTVDPPAPPALAFKGTLVQGGRIYAMISDGTSARIFGRGDTIGGYKVTAIWADSVSVRKRSHNYIIK